MKWLSIGAHGISIFLKPKASKHNNPLVRETLLNKYIKTPLKYVRKILSMILETQRLFFKIKLLAFIVSLYQCNTDR